MKIQGSCQGIRSLGLMCIPKKAKCFNNSKVHLQSTKNRTRPISKCPEIMARDVKPLRRRSISVSPDDELDRKALTNKLLLQWSGKNANNMESWRAKAIEDLNGSAMMAVTELVRDGNKLSTCRLPNCLICSKNDPQFEHFIHHILRHLEVVYNNLVKDMRYHEGLCKTPVLIAPLPKTGVMAEDEVQPLDNRSGVLFYPRIEEHNRASGSMTTLYVPRLGTKSTQKQNIVAALGEGLRRAMDRADEIMPDKSRETAHWLMAPPESVDPD